MCLYFLTEREELNIGDWCSAILYILQLITRPDIKIFLPPIGGLTIYIWGDPDTIPDEDIELIHAVSTMNVTEVMYLDLTFVHAGHT